MKHDFTRKLENGEYIFKWRGYTPFWVGAMYGGSDVLDIDAQRKYKKCWGSHYGIGEVEWWVLPELVKLSEDEQDELVALMETNKQFSDLFKKLIPILAGASGLPPHAFHRIQNHKIYEFLVAEAKETVPELFRPTPEVQRDEMWENAKPPISETAITELLQTKI